MATDSRKITSAHFTESVVEDAALERLGAHGPEIGYGQPGAERDDWAQVALHGRLRDALRRLNPQVPDCALEEAFRKFTRPDAPSLIATNHAAHRALRVLPRLPRVRERHGVLPHVCSVHGTLNPPTAPPRPVP